MPPLSPPLILSEAFQQQKDVIVPTPEMLALPEKVLQFGTGGFLRGFADYFIDKANRQGLFNGRVVMVGSTGSNRTEKLNTQGGLYTLHIQGIDKGQVIDQFHVVGSVSRVLAANKNWHDVLAFARDPRLEVIISNTTEVGIVFIPEASPGSTAPASFPAKLTAVLYERAQAFLFDPDKGVAVLPCELIDNNGAALYEIVRRLAIAWKLDPAFLAWLETAVSFCNTLVDRIVPGSPAAADMEDIEAHLGFKDELMTTAEVYHLWPIEADEKARKKLTFVNADPGVIFTENVMPYKERKVRILNGGHTASVPLAFLAGEETVLSMMQNPLTAAFVRDVIQDEIVKSLDVEGGALFAGQVIERFSNPFLRHRLIDITLQSTSKWRLRLIPSLLRFYEKEQRLPLHICLGFAAYLVFMKADQEKEEVVLGVNNGKSYPIRDDHAAYFLSLWTSINAENEDAVVDLVARVCAHEAFWGVNLALLEKFVDSVAGFTWQILTEGAEKTLRNFKTM